MSTLIAVALIPCLGAEPFMHTLLQRMEGDMAMSLSSLQFLKLDPSVRSRAAEALVPVSKMKVPFAPRLAELIRSHRRVLGHAVHRAGRWGANRHARSSEEALNPPFRCSFPPAFWGTPAETTWHQISTFC